MKFYDKLLSKHGKTYYWKDIRVLGELKQSEIRGKYTEELLSFCGHAREVFASQLTRLFLHGFFSRGGGSSLSKPGAPYATKRRSGLS
jgi:hypothetical protein